MTGRGGFPGTIMLAGLLLAGCATTPFTSTWKAPDADPVSSLRGQKVVALVLATDVVTRHLGEEALAAELTLRGGQGIAGYTLIPDFGDEARAKALMEQAGAAGVVSMRPVGRERSTAVITTSYSSPSYRPYWGGYYGRGLAGAYQDTQITTDTIVSVETLVYSLKQNRLLWGGQSKSTNPANVRDLVKELVGEAVKAMKKDGVL